MERTGILSVHNKPASDRAEGLRSPFAKTFALATVLAPLTAPVAFKDSAEAETTDKILVQGSHQGDAEIYSVNPGGARLKDLTEGPEVNEKRTSHPVSPYGKRILISSAMDTRVSRPQWSPTGAKIACSTHKVLRVEVQIVARDPAGSVVKKSWRFEIT